MAGALVPSANLRSICWAIDGTGLILATNLLALIFIGRVLAIAREKRCATAIEISVSR